MHAILIYKQNKNHFILTSSKNSVQPQMNKIDKRKQNHCNSYAS